MARKIFISYRRDDSAGYAGRVHERLQREFSVFMDFDSIPLGVNVSKVIGDEVAKCDTLLAVIGPGWLDARDENGNRRLENPDDFVRIEIGAALKRGIRVIPILLEGTRVPKADQLTDDLKELALRNGLDVRNASFPENMERLIRELKEFEVVREVDVVATERIGRHALEISNKFNDHFRKRSINARASVVSGPETAVELHINGDPPLWRRLIGVLGEKPFLLIIPHEAQARQGQWEYKVLVCGKQMQYVAPSAWYTTDFRKDLTKEWVDQDKMRNTVLGWIAL